MWPLSGCFIIGTESWFHETPVLSKQHDQRVSAGQADFKWKIVTYPKPFEAETCNISKPTTLT